MNVSVKATKRNTVVHVGDGRRLRGPYTDPETDEQVDGEIASEVPRDAAEAIVAARLGRIVKTPAPAEA